jgi:hypothetical protein
VDVNEREFECVDWIQWAQDWPQWRSLMSQTINLRVSIRGEEMFDQLGDYQFHNKRLYSMELLLYVLRKLHNSS